MKCERTRTKERWTWAEVGERKNERTNERTNVREKGKLEENPERRVKERTSHGEMESSQQIGETRPFLSRARFHSYGNIGAPLFPFLFSTSPFSSHAFSTDTLYLSLSLSVSRQVASPSGRGLVRSVVVVVVVMSSPPGKISSPGPATLGSLIMPGHLQASRPLRACSGMIHVSRCTDKTTIFISVAAANATTSKLRHRVLRFEKKVRIPRLRQRGRFLLLLPLYSFGSHFELIVLGHRYA